MPDYNCAGFCWIKQAYPYYHTRFQQRASYGFEPLAEGSGKPNKISIFTVFGPIYNSGKKVQVTTMYNEESEELQTARALAKTCIFGSELTTKIELLIGRYYFILIPQENQQEWEILEEGELA